MKDHKCIVILLSLMLLHYIDSFFPKSCLCQFLTAAVPKKRRDAKFVRMARVFVPNRGFVTCDCETAEEAINSFEKARGLAVEHKLGCKT